MSDSAVPDCAPIALFAYKRAGHLQRCLDSLRANPEAARSALHVFCDGPRTPADTAATEEVRAVVSRIEGFASVTPVFRARNAGLARSIIEGVTALLERYERLIVVEDDLLLSPYFLRYMNSGLELYAADERVASIHAYCYPVRETLPETFFLRGADCWGWGTWRRAWQAFRADGAQLLCELRERGLEREFDLDGAYPFTRMLVDQVAGRNESWAIRWHASAYLREMLTLYPGTSLVRNIGNDASGTHSRATTEYDGALAQARVNVSRIPVSASDVARDAFIRFLRPTLWGRMRRVAGAARSLIRSAR